MATLNPYIAPGRCQCGCGEFARIAKRNYPKLGTRKGEPLRFAVGHRSVRISYDVDPKTGCWIWARGMTTTGYGQVTWQNRPAQKAHRVVYTIVRGPVPAGMDLDHICRNRPCVNPDHLRVVTRAVNIRAGRVAKLTMDDVRNIRELAANGVPLAVLSLQFHVAANTIHSVVHRRTWKDIDA